MQRQVLHRRLTRLLEPLVVLGALATIPLTLAEEHGDRGWLLSWSDWGIWALFLVDLVVLTATAPKARAYLRSNWIYVLVVVASFPMLPAILGFARVARLIRLLRLAAVVTVALPALKATLARKGLVYLVAVTVVVVAAGAGALTAVEPSLKGDFWSGLWFAVVTTTTVGYGDISPTTVPGRLIAVVLMVIGIGLTATLAASVAAYFVGQDADSDTKRILSRLERIEELLAASSKTPDA